MVMDGANPLRLANRLPRRSIHQLVQLPELPMNATPPIIPPALEGFAKAAAALAESHGIKRFEMTVQVDYGDEDQFEPRVHHTGEVKVIFSAKDGRGRPCSNLAVHYDAKMRVALTSTPESVS